MSLVHTPSINLAHRPFRNNSIYYGVFITCAVLLTAASGYNVYDFVRTGGELARLNAEYTDRQQKYLELREEVEKMKKDVGSLDLTTLNAKSAFANGLILSRLFSWSTLFDRIEDLIPPNVRIRSIRPAISNKGIEIQIDGMARVPGDLYEFEQGLVNSNYFTAVYPVSENSKESRDEINFDLSMNYVPAGKNPTTAASSKLPATPTEGLPKPEVAATDPNALNASIVANAPNDPNAQPPAASAQTGQPGGQPGAQPVAIPPVAAQPAEAQPAETQPRPAPAPPGAPLGAPLGKPPKPPRLLTNKEFIDWAGQERFVRIRGRLHPKAQSQDSALSNEEFINKHGLDAFIKTRGSLTIDAQQAILAEPSGGLP
ncbi:MAG TPA: hypothetical protein VFE84_05325 [Patescibacteria group bacterium]|nr:hypothetical protein [Patescibacteria group bacterium]